MPFRGRKRRQSVLQLHARLVIPHFACSGDALINQARNQNLTDSSIRSYAAQQIQFHNDTNDINQIVISNSQLLLSLIPSLLLIGVGLIGFGKRTGLAKI